MLEGLMNCITWVINFILILVGGCLDLILSFLPNSPFRDIAFQSARSGLDVYFGYLAWLLPIKKIIVITGIWVSCIAIYFVYSIIMRWVKMIE